MPSSTRVSLLYLQLRVWAHHLKLGGKYLCYKVDKRTYRYCIPLAVGIKSLFGSHFIPSLSGSGYQNAPITW
jgi:hypothetical protein